MFVVCVGQYGGFVVEWWISVVYVVFDFSSWMRMLLVLSCFLEDVVGLVFDYFFVVYVGVIVGCCWCNFIYCGYMLDVGYVCYCVGVVGSVCFYQLQWNVFCYCWCYSYLCVGD